MVGLVCRTDRETVGRTVCLCLSVRGCLAGCLSVWLAGWLAGWLYRQAQLHSELQVEKGPVSANIYRSDGATGGDGGSDLSSHGDGVFFSSRQDCDAAGWLTD